MLVKLANGCYKYIHLNQKCTFNENTDELLITHLFRSKVIKLDHDWLNSPVKQCDQPLKSTYRFNIYKHLLLWYIG